MLQWLKNYFNINHDLPEPSLPKPEPRVWRIPRDKDPRKLLVAYDTLQRSRNAKAYSQAARFDFWTAVYELLPELRDVVGIVEVRVDAQMPYVHFVEVLE